MSHYNVNASVPKTLIKHLVRWVAASGSVERGDDPVLDEILATTDQPGARSRRRGCHRSGQAGAEQRGERRPVRAAGLPPLPDPALRLRADQGRVPGLDGVARREPGRVARRARRPAQRLHAGRDQEAPAHVLLALLQDQPVQALARAERAQGRLGRIALAARRLARAERLGGDGVAGGRRADSGRLMRWASQSGARARGCGRRRASAQAEPLWFPVVLRRRRRLCRVVEDQDQGAAGLGPRGGEVHAAGRPAR